MGGADADERGGRFAAVIQPHACLRRTSDDMEVGDDVAVTVPHEARAGALGNAEHVARPRIDDPLFGGDVDDRTFGPLEEPYRRLLILRKRATLGDRADPAWRPKGVQGKQYDPDRGGHEDQPHDEFQWR